MNSFISLKEKLLGYGRINEGFIVGVSIEELDEIERNCKLKLPESYKNFMLLFGREFSSYFKDVEIFYPDVLKIRDSFLEMLDEESIEIENLKNIFVFKNYQDWHFNFFYCDDESGEPPIYSVSEDGEIEKVASNLKEFILKAVEDV